MAKGYIRAQNGEEIEIVDASARADVSSAKSQLAKLTAPSGELEIAENGTYDVTKFASILVNVLSGGSTTPDGGTTIPANTWFGLYSISESLTTKEGGWSVDIPHGLGAVPDWAIVLRTTYSNNTSYVGGWIGYTEANFVFTNAQAMPGKKDLVSIQDEAALYLHAKQDVLTCKTPSWGGSLFNDVVLMVAVGLNGGASNA